MRHAKKTLALAAILVAHAPKIKLTEANDTAAILRRLALKIARLSVLECNRELTAREQASSDQACAEFEALCSELGCAARFGDPRGYTVHIVFPDGHHNTWGGPESGWGID